MLVVLVLLSLASLIASGVLFSHQRLLTYLAAAGVLVEGQWLLLTLVDRTVARSFDSTVVFGIGALVMLAGWSLLYRRWRRPVLAWRREVVVLVVLTLVLTAAWSIVRVNGLLDGKWVVHGFYSGDTMTLLSLIQRSFLTDGLVASNPFAGGGELEYPTLLHGAAATALGSFGIGTAWLALLGRLTLLQILLTVPLFFLLWDQVHPEPREAWRLWFGIRSRLVIVAAQAAIVLYVMALSWDGYVYPQSHFFITGLFLLQVAALVRGFREKLWSEYLWVVPASVLTLVLLFSNAVTGTAAVAVTSLFYILRAADRSRPIWQRADYLLGVVLWLAVFVFFTPGEAAFGWPHFAYAAAGGMLRLTPVVALLLASIWLLLDRQRFVTAAVSVLLAMAFVTFFFSVRNIVVDNAERFVYHAVLVGFPLLLWPALRSWYWLHRQLVLTSRSLPQQVTGWVGVGVLMLLLLLPAGASVASAHDHLMLKDEKVVSAELLEALAWIRENASANAVIIASPESPWTVPQFTGRSLLRIDHWLSPPDATLHAVQAAFEGERAAQKEVLQAGDFLLLPTEDQSLWDLADYESAFSNNQAAVYRLRGT